MRLDPQLRRQMARARDALEANDARSIRDVARLSGMSPFHFIRVFEAVFGVTPHQYRIAARLDRARRLLAGGASVTDACLEVGFSSVPSFSHAFKARMGEPPSAFARRIVQVPGDVCQVLHPGCFSLMLEAYRNSR